ncbi:MAG TPA: alginate lyase family protein [Alphaproteobacteria bacterium]|nr:alginate lyase family protein [Alphaproteobacteria bacterium]
MKCGAAWRGVVTAGTLALILEACASAPTPRLPAPALQSSRLEGPFDVASSRAASGLPSAVFDCRSPPKPARTGGEIERAKLEDLVRAVAAMSDAYVRARPPEASPARCALDWLDAWALDEALMDRPRRAERGRHRLRALAGLSLAYLKIRDEDSLSRERKDLVEAWFAAAAHAALSDTLMRGAGEIDADGVYWAALAATAAGAASGDRGMFDWGVAHCRDALAGYDAIAAPTLRDDLQILAPLVMTAELAKANGVDLYGEPERAIHRRVGRVRAALADGGWREVSGRSWSVGETFGARFAWAEPYVARFPDAFLMRWIATYRPLSDPWLGGDATLLFAARGGPS